MSRKPLIAANWKMHKTHAEARVLVKELLDLVGDPGEVEVLICPPFTALDTLSQLVRGTRLQLGGQNLHWEVEGAFTGEISASMLLECGCRYVVIGHSERRQFFHDSDKNINDKLKRAFQSGLWPVLCVGESLEQREAGQAEQVVVGQLDRALQGISEAESQALVVAYEPVWAIGTGKVATPEIAESVHALIRHWLTGHFSEELGNRIRLLYGGSVEPENTRDLMSQPNIDGALVGGASLKAPSFARIVEAASGIESGREDD